MKNIRIDAQGRQRCWNCGGTSFNMKRTVRSKLIAGPAAMATKKKLKCLSCGEFNDVGNAQAYSGPKSKRAARKSGALLMDEQDAASAVQGGVTAQAMQAIVDAANQANAASSGPPAIAAPQQGVAPPPPQTPSPPAQPPDWYPDPAGRFEHRYWDGVQWTAQVATGGVVSQDVPQ